MSTPKKTTKATKEAKATKSVKVASKAAPKAAAAKTAAPKTPAKKAAPKKVAAKTEEKAAPAKKAAVKAPAKKVSPKATKKDLKDVVFNVYSPDSNSVEVAGEFNNWTPAKMKKGEQGVWSIKLKLAAGTYQYKFVFDGSWEIDQANPDRVPDGQGGENSVKNV
ncbi:MAG: glycogen-binding domain-containing protein [Fibrobacter sp.]|nr:glycogen-binding domain-containing protein [Fibrobacter sp.]